MNTINTTNGSPVGVTAQFKTGDYRGAEAAVERLLGLGIKRIRTAIDWDAFRTATGRAWCEWLIPALATRMELLPCFVCNFDADDPKRHANFTFSALDAFGSYFSAAELLLAPGSNERDPRLDPDGARFADALGEAIQHLRGSGKKVALGVAQRHVGWLELFGSRGLLREADALGLRGRLQMADLGGLYWQRRIAILHETLRRFGSHAEIWLTDTFFCNNGTLDRAQIRAFVETLDAPAQRIYWRDTSDTDAEETSGLFDENGAPQLLARLLSAGGPRRLREVLALSQRGRRHHGKGVALITGGAGFIGANLAASLLREGRSVRIFDNLSRPGAERNLRWLAARHGEHLEFRLADVRDRRALRDAVADATEVYHFAAQPSVTADLADPLKEFDVNGRGTLNLLEELRRIDKPPPLLFTSTHKVYGKLDDLPLKVNDARYEPADPQLSAGGIDESAALAFSNPHGCSKGAADQYVLDYSRTCHLPAVVLRMSSVYGPQFGEENQGWVTHFAHRALAREPIVVYGDGRQVRDILFVDDLVEALLLARDRIDGLRGQAFNIGGGPGNALSLRELIAELGRLGGGTPEVRYEAWRAGDPRYYVSNVSRFRSATGWSPRTGVKDGLAKMAEWMGAQPGRVAPAAGEPAIL